MTGIWTFKPGARPVITPTVAGGVFLGMHLQSPGDSPSKTFLGAVGLSLRVFQIGAGSFTWTTGADAQGNPRLFFSPLPETFGGGPLRLLVFAA